MLPIFKSHFSIGKSILTLDPPSDSSDKADSVFSLAQDAGLKEVVLVEDSFMGFLQGQKVATDLGLRFIFGLRVSIIDEDANLDDKKIPTHKIIVFAKNSEGCKNLFKIYSESKSNNQESITLTNLKPLWDSENLDMVIPFYDSFLFCNLFLFNSFVVDLSYFDPKFFIETNDLPYDSLLKTSVKNYCSKNNYETLDTKSIYYNKREDFDAYITYKLICSRNTFSSNKSSLEKPNFDHMGSREFCLESYMELTQ